MDERPPLGMRAAGRAGAAPMPWSAGAAQVGTPLANDVGELLGEVDAAFNEGVVVQSHTGEIIWHNSAICRLLGTPADRLAEALDRLESHAVDGDGQPIPPEGFPATATIRTRLPVRDRAIGVESGDGHQVWLSISSRPGTRAEEFVAITTFRDITHEESSRRELEGALRQVHAFLTQAKLPTTDRIRFAAAHQRAPKGSTKGHDFFGAHELAPDRYGFYVGTVATHAPRAACVGSLARDTLRSAGMLLHDPGDVLQHLHETMRAEWPGTTLRALFGYVEIDDHAVRIRLAGAGASTPLLIGGEDVRSVALDGPMIGAATDERRQAWAIELPAGSRLAVASGALVDRWGAGSETADLVQPLRAVTSIDELADRACSLSTTDEAPYADADLTAVVVGVS